MAKVNRGRGSASGLKMASNATQGGAVPPDDDTNAPVQGNPNAPAGSYEGKVLYTDDDGTEFHEMTNARAYYQAQKANAESQFDLKAAMQAYVDDKTDPTATGNNALYSKGQNLNHALANGLPLTANQQFMYDTIQGEMHPLGGNYVLTRYEHNTFGDSLLRQAGVNGNITNMSVSQIRSALTGRSFTENKLISTSYNDFKNAPQSNPFTNRVVKIEYHAKSGTQALMMRNGGGGDLGEVVLGYGQKYTIRDVQPMGTRGRTKGQQSLNAQQIKIIVDVG